MSWIKVIPYAQSTGRLRAIYERIKGPGDAVDNIVQIHSLRPHTMQGHMALYKSVLHHTGNHLPPWLLETVGMYVSLLNRCDYCVDHHLAGLRRLLDDDDRVATIRPALEQGDFAAAFTAREGAILEYSRQLTVSPADMNETAAGSLREVGLTDGEILEVNQVVAYFAYANRTVLGLGVTTRGDILGLSPGDSADERDWQHH
ncbi:MAG: peroxidase-related enzyme [Candidatus Neomarinimicrobiota bacterium]